ncbi:MAG: ABC transporter ATP-binding protein [Dongiaceae bacterium]
MAQAESGLVVEDLAVAFRGGSLPVVRGISFRIAPGEALGLVGESGSGKSLTARAVLGLMPRGAAVAGRIALDGVELAALPERERARFRGGTVAMIFQDPMSSLNPVLRVGDAVAQVVASHGGAAGGASARAVELLRLVGIAEPERRARAFPHEFSGGMRQRIMIAMALAAGPSLLLADEPTTALDVIVQAGILRLVDRLRRERAMALLFVSHDLAVVAQMCDRIAVLYAGEIVEEGPAEAVLGRPRMPYTIGLLQSLPGPRRTGRLPAIPGLPPGPGEIGPGCAFAPRCPIAADACRTQAIPLVEAAAGHRARCIRLGEAHRVGPALAAAAASHTGHRAAHAG